MVATTLTRFCNETNLDFDGYQRLFKRRGEFNDGFIALLNRLSAKLHDYTLARAILGGDLITPEEIMTARPDIVYSDEQIIKLAETIPNEETLRWCKANSHAVIAGPPESPMWILISKKEYVRRNWNESVPIVIYTLSVDQVSWCINTFFKVHHVRLFPFENGFVQTSTLNEEGTQISICCDIGGNILKSSDYWVSYQNARFMQVTGARTI